MFKSGDKIYLHTNNTNEALRVGWIAGFYRVEEATQDHYRISCLAETCKGIPTKEFVERHWIKVTNTSAINVLFGGKK